MSYPQAQYGEYSGFRKKFKRVFKPLAKVGQTLVKPIKKPLRTLVAATAPIWSGGTSLVLKGKALGIKSKSSTKLYKKIQKGTRIAAVVAGVVVGGVFLAPLVGPALTAAATSISGAIGSAGTATLGALKFVGGKLVSAPLSLMNALKGKGIDPATATPSQVIQAGQETGAVSPSMLESFAHQYMNHTGSLPSGYPTEQETPEYPGGADYPAAPGEEEATVSEGGMFGGGNLTPILYLGAGFLALMMFGGKKGRA